MVVEVKSGAIRMETLAADCGAPLHKTGDRADAFTRLCTDSREADAGTLFIALRGERVDGHAYIAAALARGCRCVLCERLPEDTAGYAFSAVLVPDTVRALGDMARQFGSRFPYRRVGVTGSVGKTTTKECVSAVLAERYRTHKTEGNYNSDIGLPVGMMGIAPDTEVAVLEMGMSGFGEIERMSRAACPDVAIITTIGTSHMEMLGSRENICRAKLEITAGLKQDGCLLLNGDEPLLWQRKTAAHEVQYVALDNADADFRAVNVRFTPDGTCFDLIRQGKTYADLSLPVIGRQYVYAALFAIAVGERFGLTMEEVRRGLAHFRTVGMRQHIYDWDTVTLVEDCYNASPESMRAALDVLKELARQRGGAGQVAVLGDMRELGESAPALHRAVGRYAAETGVKRLFTFGPTAECIAQGAEEAGLSPEAICRNADTEHPEITGEALGRLLCPGDIVLVKASRSLAAERVIAYLKEHKGAQGTQKG